MNTQTNQPTGTTTSIKNVEIYIGVFGTYEQEEIDVYREAYTKQEILNRIRLNLVFNIEEDFELNEYMRVRLEGDYVVSQNANNTITLSILRNETKNYLIEILIIIQNAVRKRQDEEKRKEREEKYEREQKEKDEQIKNTQKIKSFLIEKITSFQRIETLDLNYHLQLYGNSVWITEKLVKLVGKQNIKDQIDGQYAIYESMFGRALRISELN